MENSQENISSLEIILGINDPIMHFHHKIYTVFTELGGFFVLFSCLLHYIKLTHL